MTTTTRSEALIQLRQALEDSETKQDKLYALEDGNFLSKFPGLTQEEVEELYQEIEEEGNKEICLYFDEEGNEELCLTADTFFEISGCEDEGFVVWESNNSEQFTTLEDAINYIKLSAKN